MAKTDFEVSLIVVNYNGFEITKNCLDSIFQNSGRVKFEVIVTDNDSNDGSVEKLKEIFGSRDNFSIIARIKNDFLTAAYNEGAKKSRGEFLVFMNNDLLVTGGWLKELLKAFEKESVGIVGPAMLSFEDKKKVDHLGGKLNFLGYGNRIASGEIFSEEPKFSQAFFIPGSLITIKKELFEKLNGFDENYQGNYEDVDLAWRARLLGYKVMVARKAVVYHLGSWTVKKYFKKAGSSYLCRKNRLATLLKNACAIYLIFLLPLYFALQLLIFFKELLIDLDFQLAMTTPKALFWNLKNLKTILKKRKLTKKLKK